MDKKINARAFTIVEISIVLFIIGIVATMSFGAFRLLMDVKEEIEVKAHVDAAVSSVIDWAFTRGRLPTDFEFSTVSNYANNLSYKAADELTKLSFAQTNPICNALEADTDDGTAFSVELRSITRKVSLVELKSKLECRGKKLTVDTTSIPPAYVDSNYIATIEASGGNPSKHKWCIEPLIENDVQKKNFVKSMKFYTKDKLFSDDCSDNKKWDLAASAIINMSNYGWKGDMNRGVITLRVYLTDKNFKSATYKDISFATGDMAYMGI